MPFHAFGIFLSAKMLPLIYAIVGFGALIAIHECGHFVFCKLFGIHTPTFSIGFGPELYRRQIGRTNFRVAAIPLGGYVEIAGLSELGQGEQEHATATGPDSFESKAYWQKLLVIAGGIIFNLLFAYFVFSTLFMVGSTTPQAVVVAGVVKESAAEKYGLKTDDAIVAINNQELRDNQGNLLNNAHELLLKIIRDNPDKEIIFNVLRGKETITLPITLGSRKEDSQTVGMLGAELSPPPFPQLPVFQALKAGAIETTRWIGLMFYFIKRLFSQRTLKGAGGPVMIMSMSFSAAQHGLLALLTFLSLISINLAVINLLPIGALDGGQILFITIEAIIGRKLPLGFRNGINIASWLLLISLAIYLTYQDVAYLFGKKITALFHKIFG